MKTLTIALLATALLSGGCEGSGAGAASSAGKPNTKPGAVGRREPLPGAIAGNPENAGTPTTEPAPKRDAPAPGKVTTARPDAKADPKPVAVKPTSESVAAPGGLPATDLLAGKITSKPVNSSGSATPNAPVSPPAAAKTTPVAAAPSPAPTPPPVSADVRASGEMVVVAVKPTGIAIKAGAITARLGDRDVAAPLWFVYPELAPAGVQSPGGADAGISSRVREWIGTSVLWRTAKAAPKPTEAGSQSAGFWVAAVSVPEGSDAAGLMIDGRRVAIASGAEGGTPRVRRVATSAFAREMLSGLRRSPMVRWRARLAAGEPLLADHATDSFADATLEGLARTTERQWASVLARLNEANGDLATRFASRLAGVVDIGDGVEIPVWPADTNSGAAMETLLADLTKSIAEPQRMATIAAAWLAAQPVGGAVVIDDASAIDLKSGLTFPSVLLANLSDQPAAAMASRAETVEPDMLRLEPFAAVFASVGAAAKPDDGIDPRRRAGIEAVRDGTTQRTMADVRVGDWRGKRAVVGEIAKIRPPGMDIGPLLSDWTQQTFLAAAMDETPRGEMQISGSVSGFGGRLKPADDQGGAAGPGRWMIMFEIVRPAIGGLNAAAKDDRSELVLSFGPRGGTTAQTLRVLADGSLYEVRNGQAMAAGTATVKRSGDRTFYWIPVPTAAIEAGKVLRLGLVRIDERGRRSAWPRPMLPWQTEPGRIAVDLSSWSPVKE